MPTIINTPLFTIFNGIKKYTNQENIGKENITDSLLSTSSNGLPNANYFSYYKVITIDHTKVNGTGDLINFPVLISIIDSDLQDKAQSDGDDIAFANNTAWLDHEIELYDPSYSYTYAQLITWVRIPLLSTSTDTIIFMFYGNSTLGPQENPTGVWNSDYKGVWHLKEDPGPGDPGDIKDSTSNSNHGTADDSMRSYDQISGQIDGSLDFDGYDDHVIVGNVGTGIKTIDFWMNPHSLQGYNYSDTGYRSPTATGETYNNWTNPTGAYTSDNNRASAPTEGLDQDWYNFGFNIPNYTIEGIEVSLEGNADDDDGVRIRLSWNGGIDYTSYRSITWDSSYDSYKSTGGPTTDWGREWSPSEFSDPNFRIWLEKRGSDDPTNIDHIRVKVYYSQPANVSLIDIDGTDQIIIDSVSGEIKTIGFPGTLVIYINGIIGSIVSTGAWYHIVIIDTSGVSADAMDIGRASSVSFNGIIDEVRVSNVTHTADWIATEYNNHQDPASFYSVGGERISVTDLQVNAIDLYGNLIPNVNISMYENNNLIRSGITLANGTIMFEDIVSIEYEYNFTVSMTSNLPPYYTITINKTSEAILIEGATQIINLICNISRNIFNVVDVDGITVDSGWIIVSNSSGSIQNCTIGNTGQATFRWLNTTPYQYNYSVWYRDINYNATEIIVASGDILAPNSVVNVTTLLTTVNFTVLTSDTSQVVSGAKLILKHSVLDYYIVNLTTDLDGKATFRWANSSVINSNYSLSIDFYGGLVFFEIINLTVGNYSQVDFNIKAKIAYTIKIDITQTQLEEFKTEIVSLNPSNNIIIETGSSLKIRTLFNVTKSVYENLLGPAYADSMSYEILKGTIPVRSGTLQQENDYIGRHQAVIETDELETEIIYTIKIQAYKSGYVLPLDLIMSLFLLKNELMLNQSQNDDSPQSKYWQESVNMSVKPYGKISEDFTTEYNIYNSIDNTFKVSIPDISNDWILSQISFNIYNIMWNVAESDINITIVDPYGSFKMFHYNNHSGHNYTLGTWTGLKLNLEKTSPTSDNNFEFTIGGSFDGNIDINADVSFIREKINVQYSRFNITEMLSLLTAVEGWAIKNITFEIYNCYNRSTWSKVDLTSLKNLNITTNEGYEYSLNYGDINGNGILTIDDRIIYPLNNQFLFTIESTTNIMFDVIIKVEYIQEFYQNQYLEVINFSIARQDFSKGGIFQVSVVEKGWFEDYATLLITGISNGVEDLLPSELAMTITVGGQIYNISDIVSGQGEFSLENLDKDTIYTGVIETNQSVTFNLSFIIKHSRIVAYETKGTVTYSIIGKPEISGTVQYYEELEYYLQTINTSLLDADDYIISFTVIKEHYIPATKNLDLIVLNRLTMINGSSEFFKQIETIYIQDAVNFTFLYTDAIKGTKITNLGSQYYIWEQYDSVGNVIASGQGTLIPTVDNLYILDFNTETLTIGEYLLIITLGKNNYDHKNAIISLSINKRIIDYLLNDGINQINVKKGETVTLRLELTDPTKGNIPLMNAAVLMTIGGVEYEFEELANGTYIYNFPTGNIDAFFTSKTLTGKINITREDYISEEFRITIVVEIEEIFPGMPTFYFILIISAIIAVVGSIATYRIYKSATTPTFVKKARRMQKAIKGGNVISESLLYRSKEAFVGEIVRDKWVKLGLSLGDILGIEIEKRRKSPKIIGKISRTERADDIKPKGFLLMKWDERIGTELLVRYPEDISISNKTLMQVYSTHEYTGEIGVITLTFGFMNILSYYTGPESGYYIILLLNLDDDPDAYEGALANVAQIILQNVKDDSYLE
ncbi:MAG: hypothetical protein ACFE9I_15020, partial [Candidatus Hermodarchaeota archaeon]